ncbi:branched-chain-amino-acid aminotransferase [Oxobacter pfennigii]|uniref:Branched-chain-amino-acid aminotransferase n=1 Tax=Oxobacter pfennigii TaxID=36849 RepID=A0A0P8WET7_9CLOT|nr:aminotransferase class IV [Oxobacter pfennigii]KPU46271.1 branched-chain-amino-acid aminotransferase [Oxobacter pfennigii]
MNDDVVKNYLIHNDNIIEAKIFDYEVTKIFPGIYEVIRVIDGVPMFLEKHVSRFKTSASLLGFDILIDEKKIDAIIRKLIEINDYFNGNVRIVINNFYNQTPDSYFYFYKSSYPTEDMIADGVHATLFYGERNNPNAKSTDLAIRDKINEQIARMNAYEALLVNSNGEITEGSRSNMFFIKNKTIITAPEKDILSGVTRGNVIEIIRRSGFELQEKNLEANMLKDMDGLFLTGTSPMVLPIRSVDDMKFASANNGIIRSIRESYLQLVNDYINSHR